jgi:hypothetical protein
MMNTHAQVMMDMLTTTLKKANIFTRQSNIAILLKDMLLFEKNQKWIKNLLSCNSKDKMKIFFCHIFYFDSHDQY